MTEQSPAEQSRLLVAFTGKSVVKGWAEGAGLLALVESAYRSDLLHHLLEPRDSQSLVAFTKLSPSQVDDVVAALVKAEVLERGDEGVTLTGPFRVLTQGDAGAELGDVLAAARLERSQLAQALTPTHDQGYLSGADALVLAREVGIHDSPETRDLVRALYAATPDYRAVLEQGGPIIDVGCGTAGVLMSTAILYEDLKGVGVEFVPAVAAEARRRAAALSVADRVEIRCVDAAELTDDAVFGAAFWAQPFFPEQSRPAVLAAVARVLRPGGLLVMQELFAPDPETGPTTRGLLERIIYRRMGVPFGLTAEQLVDEAERNGFSDAQIIVSGLGRIVQARKNA